uniref:Mannan-binding lectin serine peptidase 1 n=1 Tax=Neogobius melanostomus TaxID=47308 RepID=A0A8C6SKH7_9GOBI
SYISNIILLTQTFIWLGHVIALSSMYGTLESPNFPEPYPRQLELVWELSVPQGFRIRLDFSHFHLEPSYLCEYDRVTVQSDSELLGLFCGSESTDTESVPGNAIIKSSSNSLRVNFSSDFSDEDKYSGFRAHYTAEDIDECSEQSDEELVCDHFCHNFLGGFYCSCRHGYQLHHDNRTCSVHCSGAVYRERSGALRSPDFPGPYPKSSYCRFQIQVQPGFKVRLEFGPHFDVEDHPDAACPYDYVKVVSGSAELGLFCGSKSPGLIETNSSSVTVEFHSDDSGENLGWSLNYTTSGLSPGPTKCVPRPQTPPNAVLTPVQSEYSFTDHALFTCQSGLRSFQHVQITCLSDGSWSSSAPSCQGEDTHTEESVLLEVMTNI